MRIVTAQRILRVIPILLALIALLTVSTKAQVSFIHITDPHIFDDVYQSKENPSQTEDNVLENRAALASLIGQINERELAGSKYQFIAVTGDLGIEALVLEPTAKGKTDAEKKAIQQALLNDRITDEQQRLITNALQKGARDLAGLIALSRVTLWLFVPGNNDVLGELPRHVRYYHEFIKALQSSVKELNDKIIIVDLCPHDEKSTGANYASTSKPYQLDGLKDYAFIGFDDSSFKNKEENLIEGNAAVQRNYVRQVSNQLQRGDFKYAYIFYHIPEIDDPWLVTKSRTDDPLKGRVARAALIGKSYFESAWFVRNDVREEWNLVVMNPKVKGLFAGHFHDSKPQSYESFDWLRTNNYPAETLSKLHVAPPIALRLQRHSLTHARGFREVFLAQDGSVKSRIVFLNNAQWDLAPGDAESEKQLALAQTYSATGKKTEAAAAYAKAAESSWPPTRMAALASLQELNDEENRWTRKYLLAPLSAGWSAGVNAFGALLVTIALALLAIGIAWPFIQDYAAKTGRNKLRVNEIVDSPDRGLGASFQQLIAQVHGTKAAHYKKRWFDAPGKEFPVLAGSQSAEVPELIETVVPSGFGKVIAWLYRKADKPRYNLSGTIQTISFVRSSLFVAVSGGGSAKRWRRSSNWEELTNNQVIVAHAALDFLVKEINSGRIR